MTWSILTEGDDELGHWWKYRVRRWHPGFWWYVIRAWPNVPWYLWRHDAIVRGARFVPVEDHKPAPVPRTQAGRELLEEWYPGGGDGLDQFEQAEFAETICRIERECDAKGHEHLTPPEDHKPRLG